MGVFDVIRGRKDSQVVEDLGYSESHEPKSLGGVPEAPPMESNERLSLEERNERNIQLHPDEVTKDAHLGVQKAEATAMVWSKPALFSTYAWYVHCFFYNGFELGLTDTGFGSVSSCWPSTPPSTATSSTKPTAASRPPPKSVPPTSCTVSSVVC